MIEKSIIDKIFESVRIVEVIEDFVSLKKQGSNYVGCCPFHNERTPSFMVSPSKNIYKCFGCGAAGSAVNFVMDHEHLSYPESLKYLAKKYNIEVVEKEQTPEDRLLNDQRESMMVLSSYASRIFQENLHENPEGQAVGMSYLKERGLRADIIKKFELGYSLELRDAFTAKALKDGYKEEFLTATGLTVKGEHGMFDRFAGRVMFPIHSLSGKPIAFGGRVLKNDKKTAKYLNSPESEIYHKGSVLYGIYHAKSSIIRLKKCLLVEGYLDVIALHQAGIENVVASSGTALTEEQVRLIKRFTDDVTVVYDGDAAGIKAALRGIDMFLKENLNVKVLLLPDGDDPDSFSRKHSATEIEAFFAEHETDFIRFKSALLMDEAQGDPVKRAALVNDVLESIAVIPDAIKRTVYLKEAASMFDMDEQMLTSAVGKLQGKHTVPKKRSTQEQNEPPVAKPDEQNVVEATQPLLQAEQEIVRLLLIYGAEPLFDADEQTATAAVSVASFIVEELRADELSLQTDELRSIFDIYEQQWRETGAVADSFFLQHPDPAVSKLVAGLIAPRYVLSSIYKKDSINEGEQYRDIVQVNLLAYKYRRVMQLLDELSLSMQQAIDDSDRYETLYAQYAALTERKKEMAKVLGNRIL